MTLMMSVLCGQVCLYFVNLVLEDYENYNFWNTPDMLTRRNMYPHRFAPMREAPPQLRFLRNNDSTHAEPSFRQ